ncbi:hypothetical protein Pogu_1672 [Pyrobaculum oguniense TE7]|uniref:Uncharacterized protein n=1 Tax=Pyrobaculum oguniense (strain DSM 13380 / JCM 10595 / TE7) TaxID=698757 RepID=H6QAS3_PYROT|nr:hypothetical protein Pogu_1672 [Pyrobaculum oguniense TE7]
MLEGVLNSTFDLRVVDRIGDPVAFVLNATARLRVPATLVVANGSAIAVYSTSNIWGVIVSSAVEGALYAAFYPDVRLPVNATLKIIGDAANATSLLAQGPLRVALILTLVEAMGVAITGVLLALDSLVVTGLNKRVAMFKISKTRLALAAVFGAFLSSLVGTFAVITAADVIYHASALRLLGMWQWWISYVLNFFFFAGIALLITIALVMRKAEFEAATPSACSSTYCSPLLLGTSYP